MNNVLDFEDIHARNTWAAKQGANLARSINAYSKNYPMGWRAEIAKNRLSWELSMEIEVLPPFLNWGFRFSAAVHDLRSSLDNAVWLIAHATGLPTNKTQLAFPIVGDRSKWTAEGMHRISQLPGAYQECIESLQPFNLPDTDLLKRTLLLVHAMDIQAKHHTPIVSAVSDEQELRHSFEVRYRIQPSDGETMDVQLFPFKIQNGHVLLRNTVPKPIQAIKTGVSSISARYVVTNEEGQQFPILGLLSEMCIQTRRVIEALEAVNQRPDATRA